MEDLFDGYIFFVFGDIEGLFVEDIGEIFWVDKEGYFFKIFGDMVLYLFVSFEV